MDEILDYRLSAGLAASQPVPLAGSAGGVDVVSELGASRIGRRPISRTRYADTCVNGTAKRGGSGGDYFLCQGGAWLHVVPTFDPNSADGYGPNQPLPPKCVRFPDQYTCPTDGPPPDG